LIAELRHKQKEYSESRSGSTKKALGQYFTDSPIAEFMSGLVDVDSLDSRLVTILDPGAGHGILTASIALYLLNNGISKVEATLYEIDDNIIEHLAGVLERIQLLFAKEKKIFTYKIINDDFVVLRPDLKKEYDVSVINPPYFKYSASKSIYSKKTSDLFKGDPNIYASFIAITLSAMKANGQIVVISPRSFLNGLYFKGFRNYLLNNSKIDLVHIFNSRKDVFVDSDVLQENVIFKMTKTQRQYEKITISTSNGIYDLSNSRQTIYPRDIIVDEDNSERMIRIPENQGDYRVLRRAENLPSTFSDEGYFISTGPVVEFRTRTSLTTKHSCHKTVPLIRVHNVRISGIIWNGTNKKDISIVLGSENDKHLIGNNRSVILKRFTSKDEPRRLVAGIYEPIEGISSIGVTNKLNYIGRRDCPLSEEEALGLSMLFNSEFMDKYYRCISGNTQVNATDIRVMKIPKRNQIIKIGKMAYNVGPLSYETIESNIKNVLND